MTNQLSINELNNVSEYYYTPSAPATSASVVAARVALPLILFLAITLSPFFGACFHACTMVHSLEVTAFIAVCVVSNKFLQHKRSHAIDREKKKAASRRFENAFKRVFEGSSTFEKELGNDTSQFRQCIQFLNKNFRPFNGCKARNWSDDWKVDYSIPPINSEGALIYGNEKDYNLAFETKFKAKSSITTLEFGKTLPENRKLMYVNGARTNYPSAIAKASYFSYLSGGYDIHLVHNATHRLDRDLKECRQGMKGKATAPVWLLHHAWDAFFNENENTELLVVAHSQGAIHLKNALKLYDQNRREKIKLLVIAGAEFIPTDLASKDSIHLVSSKDPVSSLARGKRKAAHIVNVRNTSLLQNNHSAGVEMWEEVARDVIKNFVNGDPLH